MTAFSIAQKPRIWTTTNGRSYVDGYHGALARFEGGRVTFLAWRCEHGHRTKAAAFTCARKAFALAYGDALASITAHARALRRTVAGAPAAIRSRATAYVIRPAIPHGVGCECYVCRPETIKHRHEG